MSCSTCCHCIKNRKYQQLDSGFCGCPFPVEGLKRRMQQLYDVLMSGKKKDRIFEFFLDHFECVYHNYCTMTEEK